MRSSSPPSLTDESHHEVARRVYRPDIYRQAANQLLEKGTGARADFPLESDGFRPPTSDFIDGVEYDGPLPSAYLARFAIGLKVTDMVSPARETTGHPEYYACRRQVLDFLSHRAAPKLGDRPDSEAAF